jgi:hypothetical protein
VDRSVRVDPFDAVAGRVPLVERDRRLLGDARRQIQGDRAAVDTDRVAPEETARRRR